MFIHLQSQNGEIITAQIASDKIIFIPLLICGLCTLPLTNARTFPYINWEFSRAHKQHWLDARPDATDNSYEI